MGKHESDVVLRFKTDGQVQYAQTLKEINQTMNTAAKEYKAHVSALGNDATATEKLTAEKKKLEIQVEGAEKRTKMLREEYEKSVKTTGENSNETKKLYDRLLQAETAENNLKNSLEKTNDALEEQKKASKSAAEELEKIEKAGEKVTGVGKGMTAGVTTPILGIGAAAIKVQNDFTAATTSMQTQLNLTAEETEKLEAVSEKVFEKGFVSDIEQVSDALVNVITQLPSLRRESEENIAAITEQAILLEEKFDSDMSETLRGVNSLMNVYGMTGKQAMDYITVATQNGLNKTDELGDNLAEYAGLFEESGYSAEEMFNILQAGLDGGAYNLDKVNDLVKEFGIRVTDGTIEGAIEEIGGSWQELYNNWKATGGNQKDLLHDIANELVNVQDEQEKAALVSQLFGSLGEDAGYKVIEAMGDVALSGSGVKTMYSDVSGAADKVNESFEKNVTWQSAVNNGMLALRDIGEVLAPYVNEFINMIKSLTQWFRGLSDGQKQTIVAIAGVVAAVGPALLVLGMLMSSITKIAAGIQVLSGVIGLVTSPIGLVVLAVIALIAIFATLWVKCEWFRNFWKETWEFAKSYFDGVVTTIVGVVKTFGQMIGANFSNIFNTVTGVLKGIVDFITGVFTGNWKQAWQGVVGIFDSIISGIVNSFKIPINFIIGLLNSFIKGVNKIKLPKWVPGIGGKGINIPTIPQLATGGHLLGDAQAIVGEAGPELLTQKAGKTTVTPLSDEEKRSGIGGKLKGQTVVNQTLNFGKVDLNNPSELDRLNRNMAQANKQAQLALG